jgi:hypothetical protein
VPTQQTNQYMLNRCRGSYSGGSLLVGVVECLDGAWQLHRAPVDAAELAKLLTLDATPGTRHKPAGDPQAAAAAAAAAAMFALHVWRGQLDVDAARGTLRKPAGQTQQRQPSCSAMRRPANWSSSSPSPPPSQGMRHEPATTARATTARMVPSHAVGTGMT